MCRSLISIGWWNCGLAPASGKMPEKENIDLTKAMIKMLTKDLGIEIIGLCELDQSLLDIVREEIESSSYEALGLFDKAGRSEFDTCIIYNKNIANVEFVKNVVMIKGTRNYKIAQIVEIILKNGASFNLFLSHWPSRIYVHQENSLRLLFGNRLRNEIEELIHNEQDRYFVMMGDYNDEPFDVSLTQGLMSSRDRTHAKSKKHILYNPFWRFLAFSDPTVEDPKKFVCDGSYYYKDGEITKWHTFDQIIFSPKFLSKENELSLRDEYTNVIISDTILELMKLPNSSLDHLPIRCAIEMGGKNS